MLFTNKIAGFMQTFKDKTVEIKEVIYFSPGDSNSPSLWSNVPYLYGRELERRGIKVHRINFLPHKFISHCYLYLSYKINKLLNIDYNRGYGQSNIARWLATPIIRKAIKRYSDADCCIFMGCGFANYWSDMPTVIFAESSIEKHICLNKNRQPNFLEKFVVRQHRKAFEKAAFISILFPRDLEYIKTIVPSANIQWKGTNVINTFYNGNIDSQIVERKRNSKKILFIGGTHYLEGANMLVKAFKLLHNEDLEYELHIIGIYDKQLAEPVDGVYCYGYLNKGNIKQRDIYYNLIFNAKVYVNPTPFWGAYSSCIEAMYFYTPCIVHPYDHFVTEFGKQINFGEYNEEFTPEGIADSIGKVMQNPDYEQMALNAHERVKDYSYKSFLDWTFEELMKTDKYKFYINNKH